MLNAQRSMLWLPYKKRTIYTENLQGKLTGKVYRGKTYKENLQRNLQGESSGFPYRSPQSIPNLFERFKMFQAFEA